MYACRRTIYNMTDTIERNSNKNSANLLVSVLVLLVTVLTISVVALVSYYSMRETETISTPITQDSNQNVAAPAPIDEREDVKIWSDSTGIGISKLIVAVNALRAEDTPGSTTDRCVYMLTVLEGLSSVSAAPVAQLDNLYRTWVAATTTIIKQCAETINATGDFSNQTKIAIDSTGVYFAEFNTELGKYVDLNR